jgi:hypothetical protein
MHPHTDTGFADCKPLIRTATDNPFLLYYMFLSGYKIEKYKIGTLSKSVIEFT